MPDQPRKKAKLEPGEPPEDVVLNKNIRIFRMVYGTASTKKHKNYTDDGTIEIQGWKTVLKDVKGRVSVQIRRNLKQIVLMIKFLKRIGSSILKELVEDGSTHRIAGKDIQVSDLLSEQKPAAPASSSGEDD